MSKYLAKPCRRCDTGRTDHPGWEEGSVHAGLVIEMVTSRNGRVVKRISTIQQYYYIVRLSVSITTIRSLIAPTEHSFIMNIIIF